MKPPWKFEPSDFKYFSDPGRFGAIVNLDEAVINANAKLAEWFKDAKVVYGNGFSSSTDPETWNGELLDDDFLQAILIDIKPIDTKFKCDKCGAKLKLTKWEVIE